MSVEVEITNNFEEVGKAIANQVEQALIAIGAEAEANAIKELDAVVYSTPESPLYVRTGRLRNSIASQVEMSEEAVYVGTNVEYAAYVEFGTVKMRPRPYLRPAVLNYTDRYRELAKEALEND